MPIVNRILERAFAGKAAPMRPPGRLRANASYERWAIPDPALIENQNNLYAWQTWVQNAIDIPSKMAAAEPFNVLELRGEETAPIKNHPFEVLLMQPNDRQSRFEFLVATFSWLGSANNCYWWLNAPDVMTPPVELWIIPPQQIQPVPDGNMGLKGYLYDPGGGMPPVALDEWDIVHFKGWNPNNKYVGLSPLQALAMDAKGDLAAQRYNTAFYDKDNAKADGILAFADAIDDGRWERLKAEQADQHGGTKHKRMMMLRAVGAGGVQFIKTQMSRADMAYLEQRQFTKEEIYDRLAPGLASALAINANEANSRTGQANLREMCIYPMHMAIAETIALKLLPRYGKNLTGEFEDVRHKDRQLELQEIQEYARYHTIDEVRKRWYGDAPDPDRGALYVAEIGKGMTDARAPEDKPAPQPFGAPPQPGAPDLLQAQKLLDRHRWQTKVTKALAAGRLPDAVEFTPDYLTDDETMAIRAALKRARSADEIAGAFRE